jgi:hypothetical protein
LLQLHQWLQPDQQVRQFPPVPWLQQHQPDQSGQEQLKLLLLVPWGQARLKRLRQAQSGRQHQPDQSGQEQLKLLLLVPWGQARLKRLRQAQSGRQHQPDQSGRQHQQFQ